jgi:hypothetical protein
MISEEARVSSNNPNRHCESSSLSPDRSRCQPEEVADGASVGVRKKTRGEMRWQGKEIDYNKEQRQTVAAAEREEEISRESLS